MKDRIIIYPLILFCIFAGYQLLKSYYKFDGSKITPTKVIKKIKIKGSVKIKEKEKPFDIVIVNEDGNFEIDHEESILPQELVIDSISTETQYEWLEFFNIGIESDLKSYTPTMSFTPLRWGDFELGATTNLSSIGATLKYKVLKSNIKIGASYYLNNELRFGISFQIW